MPRQSADCLDSQIARNTYAGSKVTRISTASYGMATEQSVRDRKYVVVHTGCTLPQSEACDLRERIVV